MSRKITVLIFFILSLLSFGCKNKNNNVQEEEQNFNYPVTIISDTLMVNIGDQTELYEISEDFMESFLQKAQDYQGHHITAKTEFPKEWGVRCIERQPEGKELWLLQSKSREWMYFVLTSGYGTQRIIDLVPVAVNIANQNQDQLETEQWSTVRKSDGSFLVTKEYERLYSLSKATKQDFINDPEKYRKHTSYVDHYIINESGHFELTEDLDSIPEYSAVIFFYNRHEKPEIWDETVPRLQAFCEENNIYYEEVYDHYDNIAIHDFELTNIIDVDITPYLGHSIIGMVMLKKGEDPKTVNFGGFDYMQMEIQRYFKISNRGKINPEA